ncbi:MAG TPA: cytidylate kinase family protein [Prolixibacteraceae bacterium]|jgi:cytidylate kinase
MKIAISGELGGGKSVLGKLLNEKLGFAYMSVGSIQRELAAEHGMNTVEFSKYMETHPEIDIECDKKVEEYGLSDSNLILDSRLAWHFVPQAFKIHLIVNIDIAASRIFKDTVRKNEQNNDIAHTIENIRIRKGSETKRFKEQYNVDINNFNNYDLVIDSSYITPESLADFVIEKMDKWKNRVSFPKIWLSPKNIYPMQSIREHSNQYVKTIKDSILQNGFDDSEPIDVIQKEGNYFIYNGHKRCSGAIQTGMDLIPVFIINTEKDTLPNGQLFNVYIQDNYALKNLNDWEDMHGFRFAKYL